MGRKHNPAWAAEHILRAKRAQNLWDKLLTLYPQLTPEKFTELCTTGEVTDTMWFTRWRDLGRAEGAKGLALHPWAARLGDLSDRGLQTLFCYLKGYLVGLEEAA